MNYSLKKLKDKQIIYCHFNNCKTAEEMILVNEESFNTAISIDPNGGHLFLWNFTGIIKTSKQFLEVNRDIGLKKAGVAGKIAVVGVIAARRFLIDSYRLYTGQKNIKHFNAEKDALLWLVS